MNMLSKPVERCRKTSCSLNLSLVLSALNALYKLLEIFCCILSLKKHLQAERAFNFSLAVVERGTFLLSVSSCAWKTTEAAVRAVASSVLPCGAHQREAGE